LVTRHHHTALIRGDFFDRPCRPTSHAARTKRFAAIPWIAALSGVDCRNLPGDIEKEGMTPDADL